MWGDWSQEVTLKTELSSVYSSPSILLESSFVLFRYSKHLIAMLNFHVQIESRVQPPDNAQPFLSLFDFRVVVVWDQAV